jgi:RNA polymerase-binding transcription factor DksA
MATAADILGSSRKAKIPARWAQHYRQLCAERDRLIARDFSSDSASNVKLDDLTESASEESQRSLSLVAASSTQGLILEILEAIQRIERGNYGICEVTGEPIEEDRLEAIPWARYSMAGQNELEKSGWQGRRNSLPTLHSLNEAEAAGEGEAQEQEEED